MMYSSVRSCLERAYKKTETATSATEAKRFVDKEAPGRISDTFSIYLAGGQSTGFESLFPNKIVISQSYERFIYSPFAVAGIVGRSCTMKVLLDSAPGSSVVVGQVRFLVSKSYSLPP